MRINYGQIQKMNGTTGWQSEVGKTLLPSYTLLAQLKDIDKTIGQISGMNMIDNASKKNGGNSTCAISR